MWPLTPAGRQCLA